MTANHLPDDLASWPQDPHELLGVHPGAAPGDLRHAYRALVQLYPSGLAPEQFRRIRAAYRSIVRQPRPLGPSAKTPFQPGQDQPADRLPLLFAEIWESACAGNQAAAYEQLTALHHRHGGHRDICIRLYWLLHMRPELDTRRSPCDWLVRGLHASGLKGPLRELYRRELADHPAEALHVRCARLLHSRLRPALVLELARWRWQAAGRLRHWEIIESDLDELRQWMVRDAEETWARMLLAAIEQLAWAHEDRPHPLLERYCREMNDLEHLSGRLRELWDRRSFLLELTAAWRRLRTSGQPSLALLQLIQLADTRPADEVRPLLASVIEQIAAEPAAALQDLDEANRSGPALLVRLGQLLLQKEREIALEAEPRSLADLSRLTLDFLDSAGRVRYAVLRPQLLQFCLREAVAPELIVPIVESRPDLWLLSSDHLARVLSQDWPLRCVYLAYRLFWA